MDKKPNVIYILADDMGYGDISALNGNCGFQTPNFDRLAAEGAKGCKTVFDVPPAYLSPLDGQELRAHLL